MKHIILVLPFFVSGCFYQSINNTDLRKAVYTCKGVENIAYIESTALGDVIVRCANKSDSEFLGKVMLP